MVQRRVWILAIGLLVQSLQASETSFIGDERVSPQQLLLKMTEASHNLNYEGTFTYQHKDNPSLQNFRILHYFDQDQTIERLQYLNGPEREVIRSSRQDDCGAPLSEDRAGLFSSLGERLADVTEHYRFETRGVERVAGRVATVLMAIPQDPYRYSYYFSVDNESGLVLKSWLVDESAKPLERYQFVELNLTPDLDVIKALPLAKVHKATDTPCVLDGQLPVWPVKANWIPAGFDYLGYKLVRNDIDMLMYSDGLSSFSVFIEKSNKPNPEGVAQRGATLAAMSNLSAAGAYYRVTVVGEIPILSAQKILQNMTTP